MSQGGLPAHLKKHRVYPPNTIMLNNKPHLIDRTPATRRSTVDLPRRRQPPISPRERRDDVRRADSEARLTGRSRDQEMPAALAITPPCPASIGVRFSHRRGYVGVSQLRVPLRLKCSA